MRHRTLNSYGIEVRNAIYSHPTLATLRKANVNEVEVRYHEHDRARIEVIVNGEWQCTATKSYLQPEHHKLGRALGASQAAPRSRAVRSSGRLRTRPAGTRSAWPRKASTSPRCRSCRPTPARQNEALSQAEADYQAAIAAAAAATKKADVRARPMTDSDGLYRETAGHTLTGGGLTARPKPATSPSPLQPPACRTTSPRRQHRPTATLRLERSPSPPHPNDRERRCSMTTATATLARP